MEIDARADSANTLIENNPKMLDKSIMKTCYSTERLFSDKAREQLVTPDLDPIPLTSGLLGDGDATFGQELFHITETETESMIQPHGVASNFSEKTVALVAGSFGFPATELATPKLT